MKIYCSGIGGSGLSAYAAYQKAAGHEVFGSDTADSSTIDDLRSQGIDVSLDQDGSHVPTDCDLFVFSEAIPPTSPERIRARDCNIPQRSYFHALGELTTEKFVIAVCGTHGKSSTTAMIAKILIDAELDPSVIVGTKMQDLSQEDESGMLPARNWRMGQSNILVVEACEYRRSFHYISPDVVVMTNVDGDHFDSYDSIESYRAAFITFAKRLPADGVLIYHAQDQDAAAVAVASGKQGIDADELESPQLRIPGEHMRQNARLALAAAIKTKVDEGVARSSLQQFAGTWRRMENKGEMFNGAIVIDDYAHHPVEIKATLQAMREQYPKRKIVCVFQPHTHHRTLALYDEFVAAFDQADLVIVPDVYEARKELETEELDVTKFVHDITRSSSIDAQNGRGIPETEKLIRTISTPKDVIITMGAGSITQLSDQLLQSE